MLLPLYVLCSEVLITKYCYISRDSARFPVFPFQLLVENLLVCGVLSLSHCGTPHTIGAKGSIYGFLVLMCMVSHILKIL